MTGIINLFSARQLIKARTCIDGFKKNPSSYRRVLKTRRYEVFFLTRRYEETNVFLNP